MGFDCPHHSTIPNAPLDGVIETCVNKSASMTLDLIADFDSISDVFGVHCFSSRLAKKLEHSWKALVHDGVRRPVLSIVFECDISIRHLQLAPCCPSFQDTVSVHRPGFYAERFEKFMCNVVFRKASCECAGPNIGHNLYLPTYFPKQTNCH